MTSPPFNDYIEAYINVLQTVYAETWHELFDETTQECFYKDDPAPEIQNAVSERFSFIMTLGAALNSLVNYDAFIEQNREAVQQLPYEQPKIFALGYIQNTLKNTQELAHEDDFQSTLETEAKTRLGFHRRAALGAGQGLSLEYMEERMDDFLEICPLHELAASQDADVKINNAPAPTFAYRP